MGATGVTVDTVVDRRAIEQNRKCVLAIRVFTY
jgi:hypothetical protein